MTLSGTITHLLFFGGSLALIMAVVQILQVFRDSKHLWLAIFFACISAIGFQQYYLGMYSVPHHELSLMRGQAVLFLLGPSMFFFYKKLFIRGFRIGARHLLHFLPPLVSLGIDIFMYSTPVAKNGTILEISSNIVFGS